MPFLKRLARFNRVVTNPILGRLAGRVPPFAMVVHRGRRSGREYRTPVWAFPAGPDTVVALTYGADSEWVQNVLAANGCSLVERGGTVAMAHPRLVTDEAGLRLMPAVVRPVLRAAGVDEFLLLTPVERSR